MRRLIHNFCMLMVAHHLKRADAWLNDVWRFASEDEREFVRRQAEKAGIKIEDE